jgi:hypothetical protein
MAHQIQNVTDMKLTTNQIKNINQSIKIRVSYLDVRMELIDHLASAVEQEMEEREISFDMALSQQLDKLDLAKFQKQVLFNHYRSSLRKLFLEWQNPENSGVALLVFSLTYLLIYIGSIEATHTYSTFLIVIVTVNTGPFFPGLFKRQMLSSAEFMSVIKSVYLLYFCMSLFFDLLLTFSPIPREIFMPVIMGILVGQLIIGIKLVSNSYGKLKLSKL